MDADVSSQFWLKAEYLDIGLWWRRQGSRFVGADKRAARSSSARTNRAPGAAYHRPMPNLDEVGGWITEQLPALVAKYKVPGAAIGVYRDGEVFDFAVGVLSHAT